MRPQQYSRTRARLIIAAGVAGVTMLLVSPPAIHAVANAQTADERPTASGKFFIVQAGPTGAPPQLGQIAQETLSDEGRWKELMELNRGIPQPDGGRLEDPKHLRPGWVLKLPDDASGEQVHTGLPVTPNPAAAAAKKAVAVAKAKKTVAADKAEAAKIAKAALKARAARKARAAAAARAAGPTRPVFPVVEAEQSSPVAEPTTGPEAMGPDGLTPRTRAAMEEIKAVFGVGNIGGFCPGGCTSGHISNSDHYTGHAIDIMLRPMNDQNRALGDTIASYLVANHQRLNVKYVVWNDMIWSTRRQLEGWRVYRHPSGDTTNPTLAHRDHVHLSVN